MRSRKKLFPRGAIFGERVSLFGCHKLSAALSDLLAAKIAWASVSELFILFFPFHLFLFYLLVDSFSLLIFGVSQYGDLHLGQTLGFSSLFLGAHS
jgi:hypothetical protein